jgi:glycosyltransferase involved in cell wall biosynthesis
VVDDKSSDLTIDVVRQYMNNSKGGHNLSLLKLFSNRGKGGAIKAGVEFCRGRYILMVTLPEFFFLYICNFFASDFKFRRMLMVPLTLKHWMIYTAL